MGDSVESRIEGVLPGVAAEGYGPRHSDHVLDLYKTYLEMADRISARRERANSFFLGLNTAITALVGYASFAKANPADPQWVALVAVAGIVLSYLWYRIIRSYRDLNSAKFKVIHAIERFLPLKPFDAEWEAVGRGRDSDLYLPFTHVEIVVPWIFLSLHAFVLIRLLPWADICALPCSE